MNSININNSTYYIKGTTDLNNRIISKSDSASSTDLSNLDIQNDKIELTTDSSTLNTLKARDAFYETCNEYGTFQETANCSSDMSYWYLTACDMMRNVGINVPTFCETDPNSYIDSIDKIKDFVKNINQYCSSSPDFSTPCSFTVPDEFFDFCDSFKQKLIDRGCN